MPIKGTFVVSFVYKISEERSSYKESLSMVHDVKNREEGVSKNLNFRFLVLKVWEERIN